MNPFVLLLLGLGGMMSFGAMSMTEDGDETGTTDIPDSGSGAAVGTVELKMVVHDMEQKENVLQIVDGENIDFGSAPVENYTFAAETVDGTPVGSMLLEYQGQTWLQNFYPYTLEDSPIDLTEGDFDVSVTAYSGRNATGDVLGSGTIAFSTTSTAGAGEPDNPPADTPSEMPAEEPSIETVELKMVVHNMEQKENVLQIVDGQTIDFGSDQIENYTFAAETVDGTPVGSMLLEYQGQTWLQNEYPYTLEDSPIDLSEGDFEVTVTAYSGTNATGDVIGSGTVAFSTTSTADAGEPAEEPIVETPPAEEPAEEPGGEPATGAALTMVIWDMGRAEIVTEVSDGEALDFGAVFADRYTFAAEMADGTPVGSMLLEYQGQTWLQNVFPYTLEDSPLDLTEGDFDVTVTAYSGTNATGDLLATQSISFSTTSEEPDLVSNEPPAEPGDSPGGAPDSTDDNPATVVNPNPSAPDQNGNGGSGGETAPIAINGTVKVVAGRVATLEPKGDDITALKIVSGLKHGDVSVNPDGTFAVVLTLSDSTADQSFTYEATHSNGSTTTHKVNLDVVPGPQEDGWGTGATHYMLETDENDDIVVEAGENHTKVYVSGGKDALSVQDIARMEGISANQVTGRWLANSKYGQSETFALDEAAGQKLWDAVSDGQKSSSWLLLERGHEYDRINFDVGGDGESELHPLYLGAYGRGDKPVITDEFVLIGGDKNIVVQDIQFDGGMRINGAENVIFDGITVREDEMVVWKSDSVTVRNSDFVDIAYDKSKNGGNWEAHSDRIQGLFANFTDGLLLEGLYLDHNGWAEDYKENFSSSGGQPPSIFSHNLYLGRDITDLTLRDTISSRGASYGAQVRSGGYLEDNVMIDNNFGMDTLGGDYNGAGPIGSYTLMTDNVITSGAHKEPSKGALTTGLKNEGRLTTSLDNIVTHLADPDNPQELASKPRTGDGYVNQERPYYDDTIVYNWHGADPTIAGRRVTEKNVDGLNRNVLDETTIQNFASQLLGKQNATIDDLADYLTAQYEDELDMVVDADVIIRYFQEGFGIAPDMRTEAETARFVPNDLGEGVRWDNRLNWTTEDLPGQISDDSVDLGGNTVIYNGLTSEIDKLEFGPDGDLLLYGGKLTATGGLTTDGGGGDVLLTDSGQLWTDGHSGDDLDIELYKSARFANTGEIKDASLTVKGGEAILATGGAIYGVSKGEALEVHSNWADVGFDDDDGGVALLAFEEGSTLSYDVENGRLGSIEEIDSGAFDESDVRSGIDLGETTLEIDLAGLNASNGQDLTLLDADEIIGAFGGADISGLGSRNATIKIDYVKDSVSLVLSNGSGRVAFQTVGEQDDVSAGEQALWDALTDGQGVFDDSMPDIPEDEEEYLEAG